MTPPWTDEGVACESHTWALARRLSGEIGGVLRCQITSSRIAAVLITRALEIMGLIVVGKRLRNVPSGRTHQGCLFAAITSSSFARKRSRPRAGGGMNGAMISLL